MERGGGGGASERKTKKNKTARHLDLHDEGPPAPGKKKCDPIDVMKTTRANERKLLQITHDIFIVYVAVVQNTTYAHFQ